MRGIVSHCGLFAACALLTGCGGLRLPKPEPYLENCANFTQTEPAEPVTGIYFATSRMTDCRGDRLQFTGYRSPQVRYGISDLPSLGNAPWKLHSSTLVEYANWQSALQRSLYAGDNDGRVLVYVHGYFNNFEDALHRASNLRDLSYAGVPTVVFTWPSLNRRLDYMRDEDSVAWAQDQLDKLLWDLSEISKDITIVSHSMGARPLLQAVERLDLKDADRGQKVRRIVLASPDIDRDQVLRPNGLFQRLLERPDRMILAYVSQHDRAIGISQDIHGYSRLGSSDCEFDVVFARRKLGENAPCHLGPDNDRLAIVDTSDARPRTPARHHDFVETCAGRADLSAFLRGKPIEWRERIERIEPPGERRVGYRIVPERVPDDIMRAVCPN